MGMIPDRETIERNSRCNCALCKKIPIPKTFGSPRKCAFVDGKFTPDNWNCETANALRLLAGESWNPQPSATKLYLRRDDQSYAAIYVPSHPEDVPDGEILGPFRGGGFIVMAWYKNHGQIEFMGRIDGYPASCQALSLVEAEAAIKNLLYRSPRPRSQRR